MAEDYVLQTKITADSTQFDATLKKTGKNLTAFSSEITKVTKIVGGLFAITSLTALAKSISDVSKEFSKATSNIVKGTGATGKALDDLAKSVNRAMLNGVGRSASEVGSMVADLNTRFDVTGEKLERMVASFDDFASVTDTDVKTSINTVADIMAKWNISIDDSDKLLDQLTVASQMSGASVTELSTSLAKGQSILSQFGMSLTESTALFASLKKNGVDTSVALAGMRTALANFTKDGKNAKTAFEEVSEKIKNARTQTEALQIATETFGIRSGAEMLKVLQSSAEGAGNFAEALRKAGGALEETDRASRTSKDALDDLKATIQATFFSGGGDTKLRDMIDGIAEAIRNFDFSAIKETFSNIGLFIKGAWGQIKQLFNNLSGSIDIATGNFEVFADMIYQYLDNSYRSIQNFVNMIDAIMKGDWSVAWEYAKLIGLRAIKNLEDSINNAIKLMPNLFNSVIEGYNWVLEQQDKLFLEIFHLPEKYFKSAKLPKFEGNDLIDTKSIEKNIEDVRKTIEEKTGKSADYSLKQLAKVEKQTKKTTKSIEADIGDLGLSVISQTDKMDSAFDGFLKAWSKQYEDLAGNWTQTSVDMANTATSAMGEMFETIGQGLVDNGIGYEDFASTAVEALSEVLKGLAAQLSALAAVNAATYNYGKAALASAGAAAALVAAGTLTAVASNMKKTSDATKEASMSLEEFRKKLNEIWSGKTSSISVISSLRQIDNIIPELTKSVEEATKKYTEAYDEYLSRAKINRKYGFDESFNKVRIYRIKAEKAAKELETEQKKLNEAQESYLKGLNETDEELKNQIKEYKELNEEYRTLYGSLNGYTSKMVRTKAIVSKYADIVRNEMLANTKSLLNTVYNSFSSYGKTIGENLMDSIVNGATKADFISNIKEYIRKQMLQLSIYTDSFTSEIADIGTQMVKSLMSDGSGLDVLADRLADLYEHTSTIAEKIDKTLDKSFSKFGTTADKVSSKYDELFAKIEELTQNATQNLSTFVEGYKDLKKAQEEYVNVLKEDANSRYLEEIKNYNNLYANTIKETSANLKAQNETLTEQISLYKKLYNPMMQYENEMLGLNILNTIKNQLMSIISDVANAGVTIGDTLISSILNGADSADFLSNMKSYIKENVIKLAIYTESFQKTLANVGTKMIQALRSGNKSQLESLKKDLESLYKNAKKNAEWLEKIIDDVFPNIEGTVGDSLDEIEKSMTSFEKAMKNFNESIKDMGGDIASQLVNGLTNGLGQSDFLKNMKDWIRKMLIQSVVYTESMKSELEAIGQTISKAITGGFTEDTMHEIRRDLSWVFEQANKAVSSIDSVLGNVFSGYASGTENATRGLHIVGESGPELVAFKGGERVYNNAESMRMLNGASSGGNNFNVTFNNLQDTSAFAMMNQLRDYNRQMAINSIL